MAVLENNCFAPDGMPFSNISGYELNPNVAFLEKGFFAHKIIEVHVPTSFLVRSSGSPQNATNHKQSPIFPRSANRHDRRSFISIWPGSSPPTYVGENELLARPSTIPTIFTTGSEFSLSLDWSLATPIERPTYFLVAFSFLFWLWRTGHIWWLFVEALKILFM